MSKSISSITKRGLKRLLTKLFTILDYRLGIRSWGLVFYAAIPSILIVFGGNKIEYNVVTQQSLLYICLLSMMPVILLFMRVRKYQTDWYYDRRYLNIRSAIISLIIIITNTIIIYYDLSLRKSYSANSYTIFCNLDFSGFYLEAYIKGMMSLYVSLGVLFFLKLPDDLPAIPTARLVNWLEDIRVNIRYFEEANKSLMSSKYADENNFKERLKKTKEKLNTLLECFDRLKNSTGIEYYTFLSICDIYESLLEKSSILGRTATFNDLESLKYN